MPKEIAQYSQRLKQKFSLWRSIDRYGAYLGNQATLYGGYNITVLFLPVCYSKGLSTLE